MKRFTQLLCVLGLTAVFILVGYIEMLMERDVTVLVFAALFLVGPVWSAFFIGLREKDRGKK